MKTLVATGLVLVLLAGCKSGNDDKDKLYDIKGKVVSIDAKQDKPITLDHEAVPGLMGPMTMGFKVADAKLLEGLKPGNQVHGKLKVKGSDYILTELKKN